MDKKWALPLGLALVALLILWGSLGMGTASKLFPEKPKAMPPVTASEGASSSSMLPQEESRRVYDASSYIRGKPLADPFHMEAMTEKTMPVETAGVSLPSSAPRTANSSAGSAKDTIKRRSGLLHFSILIDLATIWLTGETCRDNATRTSSHTSSNPNP